MGAVFRQAAFFKVLYSLLPFISTVATRYSSSHGVKIAARALQSLPLAGCNLLEKRLHYSVSKCMSILLTFEEDLGDGSFRHLLNQGTAAPSLEHRR